MDTSLQVTDPAREGTSDALAEMPLVTMAWRSLSAAHRRQLAEARRQEDQAKQTSQAMASLAEQIHRLGRTTRSLTSAEAGSPPTALVQELQAITGRLVQHLTDLGVESVAPEGQPYTAELMELIDNIAQQTDVGLREPHVAEVIEPAILYRGELLRMGKAVIAVPASPAASEDTEGKPGE